MTPPKPVCYWLEDGTKVLFPIGPIDRIGISVPGWAARPDGEKLRVEDLSDGPPAFGPRDA